MVWSHQFVKLNVVKLKRIDEFRIDYKFLIEIILQKGKIPNPSRCWHRATEIRIFLLWIEYIMMKEEIFPFCQWNHTDGTFALKVSNYTAITHTLRCSLNICLLLYVAHIKIFLFSPPADSTLLGRSGIENGRISKFNLHETYKSNPIDNDTNTKFEYVKEVCANVNEWVSGGACVCVSVRVSMVTELKTFAFIKHW